MLWTFLGQPAHFCSVLMDLGEDPSPELGLSQVFAKTMFRHGYKLIVWGLLHWKTSHSAKRVLNIRNIWKLTSSIFDCLNIWFSLVVYVLKQTYCSGTKRNMMLDTYTTELWKCDSGIITASWWVWVSKWSEAWLWCWCYAEIWKKWMTVVTVT